MEISKRVKDKVFLIGLYTGIESKDKYLHTMEELAQLSKTADAEVIDQFIQNLDKPNPSTYIGKGKIEEISQKAEDLDINTLIFNDNLTPAQARNIARISRRNIVDRTELILDIFSKHAKTKQAKLQVELALLEYNYSKLRNLWQHFSRIEGGIGFRGPGEKQIELDRREIKKKISILKKRLEEIEKVSQTKRKKRKLMKCISLVGYTNAGKTTLFNKLTSENRYVADQLFATLDSKSRLLVLDSSEKVVISDTIGFIRKLPHLLINSFHSTLLEVLEADLLIHVIDFSEENIEDTIDSVTEVLKELGADKKEQLYVFNKIDKLDQLDYKFKKKKFSTIYPDSVFISAIHDTDLNSLKSKIEHYLSEKKDTMTFYVPLELKKLITYLNQNCEIIDEEFDEPNNQKKITARIPYLKKAAIEKQITDYYENEYIHNK